MKKLVRVSLFVLMALTLSLAIGCKHDSDPEPAKEGSRTPFVGTWVDDTGDVTCTINDDGTFVAEAEEKYEGKYHVSPDGKTVTATTTVDGNEVTFTLTSKSEDTLELTLPENLSGEKVTLTKKENADSAPEQKPTSANFEGTWVDESGDITCTINADGTFVTQADKKYEGKYNVSPDGKTVTATTTVDGKEETFTLTSKSEDTLELTLPASFGGAKVTLTKKENADSAPEQKPASSNFVGEWKSTDGSATVTVTSDGEFTTEVTGMPGPFSGTYTVSSDGKTLTTSEITLPGDTSGTKVAFSMKLKDSETDVMDLPLSEKGMGEDLVLVKVSTTTSDLTGTWKGKVVSADNADATIVFADNEANLTLAGQTVTSTNVTQNGNSFTITLEDDQKSYELTGLISVSDKAWLNDGSVFTKQ